ncbi:MAG: two-component system response regulator [Proteobacteria bacterium]|nr:MAG: two-component system response regulator [Pseudomonadota bacterium]
MLIVDDDKPLGCVLKAMLRQDKLEAEHVLSGRRALEVLETRPFDVVITDLRMPQMDGMELLAELRRRWPALPVLMLTAHGTVATAVEAMRLGAASFLLKPFEREQVLFELRKAALSSAPQADQPPDLVLDNGLIGESPAMREVYQLIDRAASSNANVLVRGESGTGKERVVEAIHQRSARAAGPLVKLHCAALPDSLIEDELFGHERGAFTGAVARRQGRFELAHGGTIFLDEIGDISEAVQVRLLRVLQERCFERIGGSETIEVDVRVITATHQDLDTRCRSGLFRRDLLYRLDVLPIWLPPLRDRADDIVRLVEHFVALFGAEYERSLTIDDEAMALLHAQPWPGNVRELRNFIERLVVLACEATIGAVDVRRELARAPLTSTLSGSASAQSVRDAPTKHHTDSRRLSGREGSSSLPSLGDARRDAERRYLLWALERCKGNRTQAARISGVSRRTFYNLLERHGIAS